MFIIKPFDQLPQEYYVIERVDGSDFGKNIGKHIYVTKRDINKLVEFIIKKATDKTTGS